MAVAGCAGGVKSQLPAQMQNDAALGRVSVTLDATRLAGVARHRDYIGAGVTSLNYVVEGPLPESAVSRRPANALPVVASGSVALTSCTQDGSSYMCTLGIPFGGPWQLLITLLAGTTPVGTASISVPTVTQGTLVTVGATVAPVLTGGQAGPSITVTSPSNPVFVQDFTTQTVTAAVNELDPLGNIITSNGVPCPAPSVPPAPPPVPGYPSLSVFGADVPNPYPGPTSDPAVPSQTLSTCAPMTAAGTSVTVTYQGGRITGVAPPFLYLVATDGTLFRTAAVPVRQLYVAPSPLPTFAGFGPTFAQTVTVIEFNPAANSTLSAFVYPYPGCSSLVNVNVAPSTAPTLQPAPGAPALVGGFTVSVSTPTPIPNSAATPTPAPASAYASCPIVFEDTQDPFGGKNFPASGAVAGYGNNPIGIYYGITVGLAPAAVNIGINSKTRR
ncbi:MAG: hypothetical protein JO101_06115 [Candidatus Eremiobacteraeota bacterium]|nr:hypothetical protein [Candidatus Eremiobacteraeota bacterium]